MDKFVISDTHFGHKNILSFTSRNYSSIEEHDQAIIDNWNSVVGPKDIVYHLGDVAWSKKAADKNLPQLNGVKHLIGGNHDKHQWLAKYFEKIHGVLVIDDVVFTHIPIHHTEFYRWRLNVHGHLHDNFVPYPDGSADERYRCVSCEHVSMTPILLSEAIRPMEENNGKSAQKN